jgi:type II secretory pathway component PulJ
MNLHASKCDATPVTRARSEPTCRKEDGFTVLVILILMSLMLVFMASNVTVLRHLHQQIKAVEKRQLNRLALSATNQPPTAASNMNSAATP